MSHPTSPLPRVLVTLVSELSQASQCPARSSLLRRAPADLPGRFNRYHDYLSHLPRRLRRSLQRQWKRSLPALALLLALGQAPALAATINVTTTNPNIVAGRGCSLIEAIENANDTATGNVHTDCATGDSAGADTIVLGVASTHALTAVNNNFYGDTGLPLIASTITIEGHGSTITRGAGAPDFRILTVNVSGNLTLNETTVSGGVAMSSAQVFSFGGGGVLNYYGALTLTNSTVSGNSASGGGGIYNRVGTATLINSTVSGNSASDGGGISSNSGPLTLTNSTVSGNSDDSFCGGVFQFYGALTLINSTVSGNSSSGSFGFNGGVLLYKSTVTLSRSLISGNTDPTGAEVLDYGGASTVTANDYNLFGHDGASGVSGFAPGATDIVPAENLASILGPLASNGGPTQTHALVTGSPAIDAAGVGCPPPTTDQRGVTRPQGAACDIGSFEELLCNGLVPTIVGTPGGHHHRHQRPGCHPRARR